MANNLQAPVHTVMAGPVPAIRAVLLPFQDCLGSAWKL
jgi:hypothetical protein